MSRLDTLGAGGGFLNGVDGTFLGATFQNHFPGQDPTDEPQLHIVIRIQEDGKPEPVETTLFGGAASGVTFAADGSSVSTVDGRPFRLWNKASGFRFLESLGELIPDEEIYADTDADTLDLSPLTGRRMRFAREKDPGATTKQKGKKRDPKTGKFPEYDRKRPIVTKVYDVGANAGPRPTGATSSATSISPATANPGRLGGKSATPAGPDPDAVAILDGVLAQQDTGSIETRGLSMAVTNFMLGLGRKDHVAVRKVIKDAGFLAAYGALGEGRAYDDTGAQPVVSRG